MVTNIDYEQFLPVPVDRKERGPLLSLTKEIKRYLLMPEAVTFKFNDDKIGPRRFILVGSPEEKTSILITAKLASVEERTVLVHGAKSVRVTWINKEKLEGGFVEFTDRKGGLVQSARDTGLRRYEVKAWEAGGALDYNPWTSPPTKLEDIKWVVGLLRGGKVDTNLTNKVVKHLQNTIGGEVINFSG